MNRANLLSSRRVRRAVPAQCIPSPEEQSHTVSDSFCCDPTFPLLIDRQLRTTDGIGAVSYSIQQRMQLRFNRSFEAIISDSDFVLNTYYSGARQCKFETDRYFVVLYETPVQYDLSDTHSENFLASFSSRDPLGWKQAPLAAESEASVTARSRVSFGPMRCCEWMFDA
ncbi:unnamed protein product [Cylicocyclus nassatus]|uniref:Ground-like domain-containing protein n=1 Tax=Cylicocyclus nassatus TaxID=53992 RepID=A0AA36HHP1_CYLNA|nr:unnamed protein product [Cylicocyclus nassatus]